MASRARCFCVSKARAPPPSLGSLEESNVLGSDDQSELRAELGALRAAALQTRAAADGVNADAIEDALDEDNPKAALIELIVAAVQASEAGAVVDSFESELRDELEALRVKALEQRAVANALDADAIEDALDEDNPKAALIELIVAAVQASEEEDAVDSFESELRDELEALRVKALEQRAVADGLDADAIEDALDEDNSKAALIELIVAAAQQRGPADRLLSCLSGGGDAAADAIDRVLEAARA
eukprot:COSAG02_NODE_6514_length_3524_cov_7.432993_1_plen_244_part_00